MKSIKYGLLFLILCSFQIFSQQLFFCEGVTSDGYPENASDEFTIPSDGGYLYALVRLSYQINCDEVTYYIYKIDSYGNKKYDNSFNQNVNRNWNWFWKEITFYKPGTYKIEVVDCYNYTVASGRLKIKY
ncbi:MAG: hypothetical protein ACK4R9_01460 [Ignavibacterium sp.]